MSGATYKPKRGDLVSVFGHDGSFEVVGTRPEGVAVIRNRAPGYSHTSTVRIRLLDRVDERSGATS